MRFQSTMIAACFAAGSMFCATTQAAAISGSFATGTVTSADLTAQSTNGDWRIWDMPGSGTATSAWTTPPLYNERSVATAIGDLTAVRNPTSAGSNFAPGHTYVYTDGTAPVSETTGTGVGISLAGTQAQLDSASFSLSITAANTLAHTVTLYGAQSYTGSKLTLSLPGATTEVDTLTNGASSTTINWVYTATFTANAPGDVLTILYQTSGASFSSSSTSNRIRFAAAAVSVVPEPTSLAGLALGSLMLLRRRR